MPWGNQLKLLQFDVKPVEAKHLNVGVLAEVKGDREIRNFPRDEGSVAFIILGHEGESLFPKHCFIQFLILG